MTIQAKLEAERPAKILANYSDEERRTFATVLQLFRNKNKQAMLLFELVETLAFQKLKEDVEPKQVTMEQHQQLSRCIPWVFTTKVSKVTKHRWNLKNQWNSVTYGQLKKHFKAIGKILENVEVSPDAKA